MQYISFWRALAALLPALFLCGFIYKKDRIEKEPVGLLAILFGLGALSYFPARLLARIAAGGMDRLFESRLSFGADGAAVYSSEAVRILHALFAAFLASAFFSVLVRWCVLYFCTKNSRHFNYLFDGIVYSVFISLGFAAAENVRFAFINGWDTLLLHLISSVPAHLFAGILMGYYFSRYITCREAVRLETAWLAEGRIKERKLGGTHVPLALSFLVPFSVFGAFLFTGAVESKAVQTVFYFVIFSLFGVSILGINQIAEMDAPSRKFSEKLLRTKHPEVQNDAEKEDAL